LDDDQEKRLQTLELQDRQHKKQRQQFKKEVEEA
jgi:hypothetical protein